jgi:AIG2-like family
VTLHFAYGSNMHRAVMRRHAPNAEPIGVASLADYRFIITADGYASVEPARTHTVHGVLWRLTPRDRVSLDTWENIAGGLYSATILPVLGEGRRVRVLVYLARPRGPGRPRAGYMELVLEAARTWNLPADYTASLQRWLPAQPLGAGGRNLKEFGWT